MTTRLQEVIDGENKVFVDACRQTYVDVAQELKITPSLEDCVIVIGSSPVKKYAQAAAKALETRDAILVAGKADKLNKAVTVVEVLKSSPGRFLQFNKTSLHSSLVNPAYKAEASAKNIQAYFGDDDESENGEVTTASILRELRGPKVYKVPGVTILLVKDNGKTSAILSSWTKQTKA